MTDSTIGFRVTVSPGFSSWLAETDVSLAATTYQGGRLFLIGRNSAGQPALFDRSFDRCMGLWTDGQTLLLCTRFQIWRLENVLPVSDGANEFDRIFVPQVSFTTGDVDSHDICMESSGRILFANTLFNCIAAPSVTHSFQPIWQPSFIGDFAAEDRCHLNGLAVDEGVAACASVVGRANTADGWRDQRRQGGALLDIRSGEIIVDQLSMPHSPRIAGGVLWYLDSGSGFLCRLMPGDRRPHRVTFCPGYARGLAIVDEYAIVGISALRSNRTFEGLELEENLRRRSKSSTCGLLVIHLPSGRCVHQLEFHGIIRELYDVAVLRGVRRPKAIGIQNDEIAGTICPGPVPADF